MTITTKLTKKEYISASLATFIARPFLKYFVSIFGAIILTNIIVSIVKGGGGAATLLPPIIIVAIYLAFLYYKTGRGYTSNKRISENIDYTFNQNNLVIVGESFKTELSWNKVYKVTTTKNWLLIWQNAQIANAILKKHIREDGLTKLKIILTNNQVKNNL